MPTQSISVRHNVEMAHRLYLTPGKCENIHGHSWQVTLTLNGPVDSAGLLLGLDFGIVKQQFREYLDSNFDHRVLLNPRDPWAQDLDPRQEYDSSLKPMTLPGLQVMQYGDPTTENLATAIGYWAQSIYSYATGIRANVWETKVNNATWSLNAATA